VEDKGMQTKQLKVSNSRLWLFWLFLHEKSTGALSCHPQSLRTTLNYTLVNIGDWCKNTFELVSQLQMNTEYSHHRYDVSCRRAKMEGIGECQH
jgi:type I site-specific restriction-modification system R (restriction) subunit